MKRQISLTLLLERIQKFGSELGGVFTYSDLCILIGSGSDLKNKRTIARLLKEKVLFKVQRGFYVTAQVDLWVLASQIKKDSYISMDSALARNGLIGTIPAYRVSSVYPGAGRKAIETPFGSLRYFSIKKDLIFGTTRMKTGVRVADSEKAYLDTLYFYTKGVRFVMDPLRDVNRKKLDLKKLKKYLKAYKNPKFVKFVEGLIDERP